MASRKIPSPVSDVSSANLAVCIVGRPRLHDVPSCEALTFLSESINLAIITGRNLKMQLRSDGFWSKGMLGRTRRSRYRTENVSVNEEKRRKWVPVSLTRRGLVVVKAIKVSAIHTEKAWSNDNALTLAKSRVSSSTKCEVNIIRK